ncbi:MAG: hypothetical protein Q8S20_21465 [Sulfuritalea sp.]|nr:hypothetical protein [Sulfuritalea sp.]
MTGLITHPVEPGSIRALRSRSRSARASLAAFPARSASTDAGSKSVCPLDEKLEELGAGAASIRGSERERCTFLAFIADTLYAPLSVIMVPVVAGSWAKAEQAGIQNNELAASKVLGNCIFISLYF